MTKRVLSKAEFDERYNFIVEFLSMVAANDDRYPAVQQAARALLLAMEREGLVVRGRARAPGDPQH